MKNFIKTIAIISLLFNFAWGVNAQPWYSEGQLGYTTYDWQSNGGARTWTHVWPDGKVSFAYTTASESSFTDRGTAIATYDAINDEWIASEGRIEYEKTGFGSIAQYGSNGIVVAAHTATDCRIYIVPDKDNIPYNSLEPTSILDSPYEPTWPAVMTSGANRDIIHVVATVYTNNVPGMENVTEPIIYFRSMDGGQTWDKQNVVLPYMGPDYGLDWGSNICYWMETTDDNCLALVVNNPWSDGMILYSYDDGETWQRKVFYHHPDPFGYFDNAVYYPRWTSCQWDGQHRLHVLYEYNYTTGNAGLSSYGPSIGGVAYWNETMPYNVHGNTTSDIPGNLIPGQSFVMDNAYLTNDIHNSWWGGNPSHDMWPEYVGYLPPLTDEGDPEDPYQASQFNLYGDKPHGLYNSGICAFPVLCMVPGTDEMIAVWSALDENHTESNGNYYYKLFASYSNTHGRFWSPMVHLTNYFAYDNMEFVYNQAAVVGRKLIVASQTDGQTGTFLQSDESDPYDNFYQGFAFNIDELFDTSPITEYTITTMADPAEGGTITPSAIYREGDICWLEAKTNSAYTFVNWTKNGEVVSTDPSFTFEVTEDATIVAHFELFDGITVGDGTATNFTLPSYSYYCHSLSQQIYTFEDLGMAGTINSLAFFNDGAEKTRTLDIYLANTPKTSFENNNDWITVNDENLVFSGEVTLYAGTWTTFVLDTPFFYDGSNLALIVDDNTGSYTGSPHMACRVFPTETTQAMRIYSDDIDYDPFNPLQYNATATYQEKNQIRLTIDPTPINIPTVNPNPIDMGYRPNEAWMRPFSFNLYNSENYTVINNLTASNPYFMLETDELSFPLLLGNQGSQDIIIDWGIGNGSMNGVLRIDYGDNQIVRYNMKANAYTPVSPDVWETAQTVTTFPFTANLNSTNLPLYNNYALPPATVADGPDAVYKLVFTEDTYLNASVTNGENGKVALYRDDFMDVGGPDLNNYYTENELNVNKSIVNMTVTPGTYYLAASSTSNQWKVTIDTGTPPCPDEAYEPTPATGTTEIDPYSSIDLEWHLGERTTSYKLLFGTDPNDMGTLVEWTRDLSDHYTLSDLNNNTIYYWQVWQRNDGCPDGIAGPLWSFTTHLNIPENLQADQYDMFDDEANALYWHAPNERGLLSYNVYMDDNLVGNTTETYYLFNDLSYNMSEGYRFNVTAVYDEGESQYSNDVWIYVSGHGTVEGHVYEQDGITPIENAYIQFTGNDEFGGGRDITFTTDAEGHFSSNLWVGNYQVSAYCNGYQPYNYGNITVLYNETLSSINFLLDEIFNPVADVVAEYEPDNNPESPYVKIHWTTSITFKEDFETGDFSQFDWILDELYPWQISDQNPHSGNYCMKSSNTNYNNSSSRMEVIVDVPYTCNISFFGKVSSEGSYDFGRFYIDGVEQERWSGETGWFEASYPVSDGEHVISWAYTKDVSISSGEDCFYVDDINFADTENTRSFQYYRVYRTDEYNNGPYTEDNTTLISEGLTDTLLIDYTWTNAELGSYKYGVSCVYAGNRDSDRSQTSTPNKKILTSNTGIQQPPLSKPYGRTHDAIFSDDFEDGTLANWTLVDADGDGNTWQNATPASYGIGNAHSGSNCASSWSWNSYTMNPDNYMISPDVTGAGFISYYVATNTGYPDHYGVYASTTGNNISDFMLVFDETCPAAKGATATKSSMTGNNNTRAMGAWVSRSINLPAGTKYVAFRHYNSYDMNYLFIDDIEIFAPLIQVERESKIAWSNIIDKGMNLDGGQVTLNVTLDSGDSPEGTLVSFTNLNNNEQTYHPVNSVVLDETGTYTWEYFRKGNYQLTVEKEGYNTLSYTVNIWEATTLNYVMNEITQAPSDLYVSSTGWANWNGLGSNYNTLFQSDSFSVDFEEGIPEGWTTIDADGDGFTWLLASSDMGSGYGHNGSNDMVYSKSYDNSYGILYPDNYIVSPQVILGGIFSFWACAQDNAYAAEHFGVAVSTTTAEASAFSTIQEWTMTAKGVGAPTNVTRSGNRTQGNWYYYTVDLSDYKGQAGYISIRHFNCYDMFYLDVDDVELTNIINDNRHYSNNQVVLTDASNNVLYRANTNNCYCQLPVENLVEGQTYRCKVASVYSSGFTDWASFDWIYSPCYQYEGADDLTVTNTEHGNLVSWTYPDGVLGAMIYRNDELVGITYENSFLDRGETGGHDYAIRVIHDGNTEDYSYFSMSCPQSIFLSETQTINLQEGWTWFSSYINYTETTLDDIKAQIEANDAFGILKSQNAYTANDLDGWSGTLTSLNNTQMYMTLMDQELTLTLNGKRVNAAQKPITLNPGWTWIAYLNLEPMSLEEAFAGIEFSDGDLIKNQNNFSTYSIEDGWSGTLTTLQPGEGYIFLNNSENVIILIYPKKK